MTQDKLNHEQEDWERETGLQETLQAIRTDPVPTASQDRCIDRAIALELKVGPSPVAISSTVDCSERSRFYKLRWRFSAAIAAIFLVVAFICSNAFLDKSAWAQVVASVTQHPWIRLTLQRPNELAEDEQFEGVKLWFTGDRSIAAVQAPNQATWVNLNSGDQFEWLQDSNQIALVKIATRERQAINPLLEAIMPFDVGVGYDSVGPQPRPTKTTEVSENGSVYVDYTFDVTEHQPDIATSGPIVVRVEKATKQPVQVRWRKAIFSIDYPTTGPTDIYALGVSKETPTNDLRSMEKYFAQRQNLTHDDYEATEVMVLAGLEGKWLNHACRYQSNGDRLEFAWANLTECLKLAQATYFNDKQEPTGVSHPMDWWHDAVSKLNFEASEWNEINYPHARCYSPIGSVQQYHSTLTSRVKDLEGTIELRGKKTSVWLDPARDYIVRRLEHVGDRGSITVTQYDEVIQDSQGHWFVTRWRSGRVLQRGALLPTDAKSINGEEVATSVHFARIKFK